MSRFLNSISCALNGIRQCFIQEAHFKVHSISAVVVISAACFFKVSRTEWLLLLIGISAVLMTELINTAIELLCNIVHKEKHAGIKLVKDMSAAAVLITAIGAAITGAVIFIPRIISFL
ncbi:MAG: diacylglycerol kinase family protein [Ferruginibacter sp.]|nr:diacylglycerol kinase family protein [Ferruginibacter sp.]